jgi:hypothetical protein
VRATSMLGLAAWMAVVAGLTAGCGGSDRHSGMHGDSHTVSTGSSAPMTMGPPASGQLSLSTDSPAGPIVWPQPMAHMGPGMTMATPACTATPNAAQRLAAVDLTNRTVAAVARYRSLAAARADGYMPITPSGLRVVHYIKPAHVGDGDLLDPQRVQSLVYANTPGGAVLVAAMYTMGIDQVDAVPPMPGGCLTQWHRHTNLCFSQASGAVVGVTHRDACAPGSVHRVTQPMIHIWLAPIPGGPLASDVPNEEVVRAAEQLAPTQPANPEA